MCACAYVMLWCQCRIRGQTVRVSVLLLLCGSWGLNRCYQTLWPVPLPRILPTVQWFFKYNYNYKYCSNLLEKDGGQKYFENPNQLLTQAKTESIINHKNIFLLLDMLVISEGSHVNFQLGFNSCELGLEFKWGPFCGLMQMCSVGKWIKTRRQSSLPDFHVI